MTNVERGTNDTRQIQDLDDLNKAVRALGRDAAMGKDALPKLAVTVVRAAADEIVTAADNGKDDDAYKLYSEYAESEGKKAVHEHTANGLKANVSKVRALIKMGEMTTCDPVDVLNRAIIIREEQRTNGADVKSAYPAYIDVARSQLKLDRSMTDEELAQAVLKKAAEEPTVEKELQGIAKRLDKLITGDNKHGLMDQDERTIAAYEALTKRIAAFTVEREMAEFLAKAEELGMDVTSQGNEEEVAEAA